jgi:hypothetical protein
LQNFLVQVVLVYDLIPSLEDRINFHIKSGNQGYNIAFEFLDEAYKVFLSYVGDNNKFGLGMVLLKMI